jgi:hypothetical protein
MLPKTSEHNYIDFLIEDYFTKEYKTEIITKVITEADGHMNAYGAKDGIKAYIKNSLNSEPSFEKYTKDDLLGFEILLNMILKIIENKAEVELINSNEQIVSEVKKFEVDLSLSNFAVTPEKTITLPWGSG